MAENTQGAKTAAKESKPSFFARVSKFFRDTRGEIKKVVWPSKSQVKNNTLVVIGMIIFFGIAIGALDGLLGWLLNLLYSIGANAAV